jgi:signal transduction histidine kinase
VKNRLIALARSHAVDVLVLVAAFGAFVELEAMRDNYGDFQDHPPLGVPEWQLALGAFGVTLPLLARHRFPFAAPATSMAVAAGVSFLDARILASSGFLLITALVIAFLFGWLEDERMALSGLAISLSTGTLIQVNHPSGETGDYVFVWIMFGLAWVAGFSLRRRLRQATEAEVRAERAVADERARIARELHDIVAHSISVMTVQASGVRRLLREDQQREREALMAVERTGRESLAEMRNLLGILRGANESPELAPQPGLGALDALARETESDGLPVEVKIEGEPYYVPAGIDVAAFRVVQDALTNAGERGRDCRAQVVVRYRPEALELEVTNAGLSTRADGSQRGLTGMRERVAFYGGTVDAKARKGGGYVVRARIPVRREEAAWASG